MCVCVCVCVCMHVCMWIVHNYTVWTFAALMDKKFYVIAFEYMLEVEKSSLFEVEYMPAEVGIVEWSMGRGISQQFHSVINPGQYMDLWTLTSLLEYYIKTLTDTVV